MSKGFFTEGRKLAIFVILLLIVDQAVKFAIKLNMTIGESIPIFGNWSEILFIENPGAAFGLKLGGDYGKLILSLFRLAAISAFIWYLNRLVKRDTPKGIIVGFGLILAGAMGNMLDSAFYGVIFSESTYDTVATLFPDGGGYAPLMYGKVVDMWHFPLIQSTWPEWMPWIGGQHFEFFSPIFNVADSYITVAVIYLILFKRKYFLK